MTAALSPFLDSSSPSALLIPDDLLTADTLFDCIATTTLTVADDPVASAALLDRADSPLMGTSEAGQLALQAT
jgi:hypothetical protein